MGDERWTLDEWGDRVVCEAADLDPDWAPQVGRVEPLRVYGSEQEEEGWRALWETTEVRCGCGAVELVRWRPGAEYGRRTEAVRRTQVIECWNCGEVLDLRLQRRDRQAQEDREDAARERERAVRCGEGVVRPVVVGSRSVARAVRSLG